MKTVSTTNVRPWSLFLILVLVIGLLFLQPFLSLIVISVLTAYIFNPLYLYLHSKIKAGFAMSLTVLAAFFVAIIPISIVMLLAYSQLDNLFDAVNNGTFTIEGQSIEEVSRTISREVNDVSRELIGVNELISEKDVSDFAQDATPKILNAVIGIATGVASSIPSFFASLIIFMFLFTGTLSYQKTLVETIKKLSPFDDSLNDLYFKKVGAMSKAMLKGQLIIAVVQGLLGAASLLFLGLGDYFLIFAVVFSFLNLIPLGSGLITIPLGIVAMLTGNVGAGLFVLLNHFLVVTNVDNILRPRLVPKDAAMPAALLILATFAGVAMFGLVGVIYGPIIMIFITTTIDAYIKQKALQQTKKAS